MAQIRIPGLYHPVTTTTSNNKIYFQLDLSAVTTYTASMSSSPWTNLVSMTSNISSQMASADGADPRTYPVTISPQTGKILISPSTGTLKLISGSNMFLTDIGFASGTSAFSASVSAATPFVWTIGIPPSEDSLRRTNKFGEQQVTLSGQHQYYQTHEHELRDITWSYVPAYSMFVNQETASTTGYAFENFWKRFHDRCVLVSDLNNLTVATTNYDAFLLSPIETLDAKRMFTSPALYEFDMTLSEFNS
jgi:hypothetical protein